jgi:hypothetical protein
MNPCARSCDAASVSAADNVSGILHARPHIPSTTLRPAMAHAHDHDPGEKVHVPVANSLNSLHVARSVPHPLLLPDPPAARVDGCQVARSSRMMLPRTVVVVVVVVMVVTVMVRRRRQRICTPHAMHHTPFPGLQDQVNPHDGPGAAAENGMHPGSNSHVALLCPRRCDILP